MKRPLRILHLEDEPHDSELMAATLRAEGLDCEIVRVDTREAFIQNLRDEPVDVIVSDVSVPGFDGITAQRVWQQERPNVPFIFLSGTFGEAVAIERLKAGATDYVLKNWVEKLPGAVRRALREHHERTGRQQAQDDLQLLAVELEQRVEERTAQLAAANQALAESERRFFDILDHSPAAIFLKDLDGRYVFVNRTCQELMRRSRQEVMGRLDTELLPPHLADLYRANDRTVMESGLVMEFEEAFPWDDGTPRLFSSSKFPLRDTRGRPYALCGVSTDITDRKHAEEAMKMARKEAERANRAKSDFLSRMSHDLRTPLNAVLGFAQLLDMDNLTPDQKESVVQILQAGRHLLGLMNEILDISRIEAGNLSLSPEPVSAFDTIDHAVKLVRPLAAPRRIEIDVLAQNGADRYVQADRQRLNQILLNFVSNAIKYNREGGRVTLWCSDAAGGRVRINVTDTGAGIRPEKLDLLFRPFERLGADETGIEGTGLGLALSRGLAEAMDGVVGVESTVDKGSTFWIELAGATASDTVTRAQAAPEPPAPRHAAAGTVLYIEDNSSNVRLVERVLGQRRPGITLLTANDGETGIAMALRQNPGLIFLDLHLPDTPGEEVLRRLWADPSTRHIPVAVLSADATSNQSRRLLAAGATAYLTKPLDVTRLLALLDERFHP
jgi:PAS domain S-box-containing protein